MEAQATVLINISPASSPIVIDATGVPATGSVGSPYSGQFEASGGQAPYTWLDISSSQTLENPSDILGFPVGTELNPDGSVFGTPTEAGGFEGTAQVADANGAVAQVKVKSKLANVKK